MTNPSTVGRSNSSVEYSANPVSPPSASDHTCTDRSKAAACTGTGTGVTATSPSSRPSGSGRSCTTSATWTNGVTPADRAGAVSSTTRSNGTSWCANAATAVSRDRATTSANPGSPDRSVRSTTVLTKNPTRSSSSGSTRLEVSVPTTTSVVPQ